MNTNLELGARYLGGGRTQFCVWAPLAGSVDVHLVFPNDRLVSLQPADKGYYRSVVESVGPGSRYFYSLDRTREHADPVSRLQPMGIHGPSEVIDPGYPWAHASWPGVLLRDYVLYEIHVGTFTAEGTLDAIIPHLDSLRKLGITAVELMPVAQFPGTRNWGYDGVYPFAVQNTYGGPAGLKRFVNACHQLGMAVALDVVYNHLGPEGNFLWDFGPYFTEQYKTAWGSAINFDGAASGEVRRFFIENALSWVEEFHVDALRLDATHGMFDFSARPFLEDLSEAVHTRAERLNRRVYLICESDRNDVREIRSQALGGYGLDAVWNDDFHHALHALLTGERQGYYRDFGRFGQFVKAFREGFVYSGQYSDYRKRPHGRPSGGMPSSKFVVFSQNHDQVGNRMLGERSSVLTSMEELKLAAGAVLLSPYIPLLFMGEEYGETAPFQYFISHGDPSLIDAVRRGRQAEFADFHWQGEVPDPQSETVFLNCKLSHSWSSTGERGTLYGFYRELIRLRANLTASALLSRDAVSVDAFERERLLVVRYGTEEEQFITVFNFANARGAPAVALAEGLWQVLLDSGDRSWDGPGSLMAREIVSHGEVDIVLQPKALVHLARKAVQEHA